MVGAAVENVADEYAAIKQIGGEPLSFKELFKKSEDGEEDSAVALGALGVIYKHWPEKDITASDVYAYLSTTEAQFDDEEKATLRDFCQPKGKGPFTTTVTAKSISRALGNIGGMPVRCGDGMQLILKAGFIPSWRRLKFVAFSADLNTSEARPRVKSVPVSIPPPAVPPPEGSASPIATNSWVRAS
jgi:hypothetical protein